MAKPVLPFIETMVTQACNLSCDGCTNYSDLAHQGYVTWTEGKQSLERWLERVEILDFGILGGEPLMNPYVEDWILGLRELMPMAQIRFTTNGLLLPKRPHIVKLLEKVGNCVFKIAVHQDNPELEATIQGILDSYNWQSVNEFGVDRLTTGDRFRLHIKRPDIFWKTHIGTYETMRPHNSNPSEAFKLCCQQTCPLLYKDKIYKCSTNGLLRETLDRVGRPNWDEWQKYLVDGIAPDCSNEELTTFLDNFGLPNRICGMCPAPTDAGSRIIHLENVSLKKIK